MVGYLKATSGGMPALVDLCLVLSSAYSPQRHSCLPFFGYLSGYRKCGGKEDIFKEASKITKSELSFNTRGKQKIYNHPKSIHKFT